MTFAFSEKLFADTIGKWDSGVKDSVAVWIIDNLNYGLAPV